MTDAALGAKVIVPTLHGDLELELEPGTQPGEVRVLRGRGMPVLSGSGRGNHRVLVNVRIPRRLSPDQRRVLEELATTEDEQMYEDDSGLIDRLKARFR